MRLLARPYRLPDLWPSAWRNALAFGLFVLLFLVLFEPFGLAGLDAPVWRVALGYGATCTAVMLLLNGVLPRFLPAYFSEPRWTVGREIAWTLVNVALIGLANLCYSAAIGLAAISWELLFRFEAYTVLIGLFPVAAAVLLNELRLAKRFREGSERVNAGMRQAGRGEEAASALPEPSPPVDALITIPSESGREDLTLPVNDLLFIRSAGNYLEIHLADGAGMLRKVLRGSLKRTEEQFAGHTRLLRCHKSHLVNLDRVVRVSGNAQGFQLHLDRGEQTVPVSRKLNDRLSALLADRP